MAKRGELFRKHLVVPLVVHQREVLLGDADYKDAF